MSRFVSPDLSQLKPAALIQVLDFEAIIEAMMTDVRARFLDEGVDYDVGNLETDPVRIVLEVAAYREMLLRALVNDKARAVLLAYATGTDLDHLGALMATARKVINPADPQNGIAAVLESDEEFRRRIELAPEAFSVAGPAGAYAYFALSADPSIVDAAVLNPSPGRVDVIVLVRAGDGVPSETVVEKVYAALSPKSVRPLTDDLHVRGPDVSPASISMSIKVGVGPDPIEIGDRVRQAVADHVFSRRRVGVVLRRDGLIAAAHSVGAIEQVILDTPPVDVDPGARGVVHVTSTDVDVTVVPNNAT